MKIMNWHIEACMIGFFRQGASSQEIGLIFNMPTEWVENVIKQYLDEIKKKK